jgi:hypothetical protein
MRVANDALGEAREARKLAGAFRKLICVSGTFFTGVVGLAFTIYWATSHTLALLAFIALVLILGVHVVAILFTFLPWSGGAGDEV